jgi:hypothetical protein
MLIQGVAPYNCVILHALSGIIFAAGVLAYPFPVCGQVPTIAYDQYPFFYNRTDR